jgi:hypothetical protein
MLKRSTVFALILLAALVGLAVYLSRQKQEEETDTITDTPSATFLFDETSGQVESLTITDASGKVVSVRRDAAGWRYEQPVSMEADAGLVEAAASQVMSLRVLNTIEIPLTTVGLNRPVFTLTVRFDTGKEAMLKIGNSTPTQSGYYVLKENGEVVIINKSSLDSLLEIFHNPPQPPTPTPSAGDEQAVTPIATP